MQELEVLDGAHTIFAVIRFYQRLWIAVEHRQVPIKYVGRLFGEGFFLWFCEHFKERLLSKEWQVSRDIESFKAWFEDYHPHEAPLWVARAKHDIVNQPKLPLTTPDDNNRNA